MTFKRRSGLFVYEANNNEENEMTDNVIEFPKRGEDGSPPPFGQVVQAVEELDPNLDRENSAFRIATVLLSTMFVGTDVEALAGYTGYPPAKLRQLAETFGRNQIWLEDGSFRAPWLDQDDPDAITELWIYCQIGMGLVEAQVAEDGQLTFSLTRKGIKQAERMMARAG